MADINADDGGSGPAPLLLSADEKRILELYDRLQQLQLEIALLNAQKNYVPDTTSPERSIEAAQKELLESRSRYVLRNDVAASVMSANPILQAVHDGANASPIERDLLPLLTHRDTASGTLAQQAAEHRGVLDALAATASASLRLGRENAALVSQLLGLAERAREGGRGGLDNSRPEIAALEAEVRRSRQRWRVLKGTASAVVAGSGVDWARDPELRDMVLDKEGDGEA
ncbi:centromere protein H (CENP-H)-domain-containing protein [Biscogniauxia mediterranea]|nr:centromere protein H (CENP-H)-domain-containing protein [Biscogniauxia mediterranea]